MSVLIIDTIYTEIKQKNDRKVKKREGWKKRKREDQCNVYKVVQSEDEFNNNKDLIWKLNEQNQLVSAINEKMGIDISGSKYQNKTPILYWELHGGNNQKWKIVNIESFDSLFVGDANSLLTLIKLIGFILVFFCFICLLRAMNNFKG